MEIKIGKKGAPKDLKINEQKKEIIKWQKDLEKKLNIKTFKKENLFILSKYWFDRYEKYIFGIKNDSTTPTELNRKFKENNNELYSSFTEKKIIIEELPKIYIINKNIWSNIKKEYTDLSVISAEGTFSNKLLTMEVSNLIYCFIFLDEKRKLRQGYIEILEKNGEKIIDNFRKLGIFNFLKEENITIDDCKVIEKRKDYKIYIFKSSIKDKDKEYLSDDEIEKKIIKRGRSSIFRKSVCLKDKKDEYNCILGTKAFNIKKEKEIDEQKKMGKFRSFFHDLFKRKKKPEPEEEEKIDKKEEVHNILNENQHKENPKNQNIIIPEEINKNKIKYVPGIIGLNNIGATCYMNATVQCFSNIKRFRENLLNIYQSLEQNKNTQKLSFALAEVFYNLWINLDNKAYSPYNFKDMIGEMNPLFKGIAANDPKDLVLFLLETIHNELNNPPRKEKDNNNIINTSNFSDVFNDFIQNYTNNHSSLVCEEFYGCSNSMTTCANCQNTIHNIQILNILFFPLEEVRKFKNSENNTVKIEDCFLFYEKQEIFPSFYCNNCEQLYPAYNQYKLIYTPPTLIINLNRGIGLQYDVGIEFEEKLDIKDYVYAQDSPSCYELVGVICHLGSNDMGGHFIAFCKNADNCDWYKFNDGFVTKSSFSEIKERGIPYVLFYSYIQVPK